MTKKILVFAEVRNGKLKSSVFECLTAARKLNGGAAADVVVLGKGVAQFAPALGAAGAGTVFTYEVPEVEHYQAEPYAQVLAHVVTTGSYQVVLASASPTGRDLLPKLSVRLKAGLLTDVVDLFLDGDKVAARRPLYAGKCLAEVRSETTVTLVSVRPNVMAVVPPASPGKGEVTPVGLSLDASRLKARVVEVRKGKSERPDLTEASLILSGGRALGSADNFKVIYEAADAIGATPGASRAAVDAGYAPHDMQVGQTGKTVNPNLYIAAGISGAIQHLAGMRTSKVVVAINTDPDAPIFSKADYGIVGDLFAAIPLLAKEIKKLQEG